MLKFLPALVLMIYIFFCVVSLTTKDRGFGRFSRQLYGPCCDSLYSKMLVNKNKNEFWV